MPKKTIRKDDNAKLVKFASGATSSDVTARGRFDLIPQGPLRRLAQRYGLGAVTHGEHSWERGIPWSDRLNHILSHLNEWMMGEGEPDQGSLAAIAWGAFFLMYAEEHLPQWNDIPELGGSPAGKFGKHGLPIAKKPPRQGSLETRKASERSITILSGRARSARKGKVKK